LQGGRRWRCYPASRDSAYECRYGWMSPTVAADHTGCCRHTTSPDHLAASTPSLTDITPPQVAPRYRRDEVGRWSRLRCWVPSLFGELQVRRQLSDLDAAGCWLGPANGNFKKCAIACPRRRHTCQSLTAYSKHANPDPIRRRGSDGRCGARVFGHRQLRSACRSGRHDGDRVKGLFNFKGAVVISLS
jgi:hypothetical protein